MKRNPKQEFKALLTRKQMLQEVLGVADRIEQLHSGLHSAMQMGEQDGQINGDLLEHSGEMDALRHLPLARLKEVLAKLEIRLVNSIQRVLAYAELELDESNESRFEQTALGLINDFRRSSKTALAMRLLLSERGQGTKPLQLPVKPDQLRLRVNRMAAREKEVRGQVETEILGIHDDSLSLLKTPNLPQPIKQMLEQTVAQMQANLEHIRCGKGFDNMPHPMEILEASAAQEVEELIEALPLVEVEEVVVEEVEIKAPEESPLKTGQKRGNWLDTPWGQGWDQGAKTKPDQGN